MGRLFWKLFLFIWIAQVIGTMSVMMALRLKHGYGESDHSPGATPPANPWIESAAATLRHGGPLALRSMIENAPDRIAVIDAHSGEFFGRQADADAVQSLHSLWQQGDDNAPARRIRGDNGRDYLLLDLSPDPPPPVARAPLPRHPSLLPPEPLLAHLVASLIVAVILAHYLLQPVGRLRWAFQAVAGGNLRPNIGNAGDKRRDELADLLVEFDRMAGQLHVLMENQRRLFHDVSHQMRSPLARVQAAVGIARQQPENANQLLTRIEREVTRMDLLIGELLALSRLEAIVPGMMDDHVAVDDLLAGIVEDARFEARSRGTMVRLAGESEAVIKGRAELLHRAIENVVRNAVKHADDGSSVVVAVEPDRALKLLRIRISDNGPGVPDEELGAIFEPFFRGSNSDKHPEGHGLGLALAKRTIEAHGGSIRAYNMHGGLCVELVFPFCLSRNLPGEP